MRNLTQLVPEYVFETDAGAMAADDDRPFEHAGSQISAVRGTLSARLITIGLRLVHISGLMASIFQSIIRGHLPGSCWLLSSVLIDLRFRTRDQQRHTT